MMLTVRVPGRPTPMADAHVAVRGGPRSHEQADHRLLDAVEVLGAYDVSPSARGAAGEGETCEVEDTDLIEFVLESGVSIWTSVAAYRERYERANPRQRGVPTLRIEPELQAQSSSRGIVSDVAAAAVRFLRLKQDEIWEQAKDPSQWPDWLKQKGVKNFDALGSWLTAKLIIWLIERKIKPDEGLYRWAKASGSRGAGLQPPGEILADQPILLFIHGTASNTEGSFGALRTEEAAAEWEALSQAFGDRIFAFEHRTMSRSPIDNALVLAKALPRGARLTLVSHSRGGQVADLLCLKQIAPAQLARFRRAGEASEEADEHDREQLQELAAVLKEKAFTIRRLLRVACPAQGTLLASENLDRFLSVVTSLLGLIPGLGQSPLYQAVKRITLETAKCRWNPSVIPGIEAMIPSAPLVALLNGPDAKAMGELGVIAGDIEGGSWFKRLGVFITDRFIYEHGDNDLVVNTDSMFQGLPRDGTSRYVFDQGADVSHFQYFSNVRTRRVLAQALTVPSNEWPPEFRDLDEAREAPVPMGESIQTRSGEPQPVVFVLPGIMGSELRANGKDVWLNYWRLFQGEMASIAIDAPNVQVTGLVSSYYRALCRFLADSHEVIPFGYDWRRSIKEASGQLATEVSRVVERTDQPIRFIAHSMGGLVVRRFIQDRPDLWDRLCQRDGARFVMLGTPNRGSFDMVATLAGMAKTIRQLALLDTDHSLQELVAIVAQFRGALELLPQAGWTYFSPELWTQFREATESKVWLPGPLLQLARQALEDLPETIPHHACVRYVAGRAPRTLSGVALQAGRLVFEATTAGDGRVTYQAGALPDVPMWYVDAEHGDLPDHEPAFQGYRELLEQGVTSRLSTSPLTAERGEHRTFAYDPEPVLYPTAGDFESGVLGRRRKTTRPIVRERLRVSVLHGNLAQTNHPVLVGHYEGDTIAGVERVVDGLVDQALSRRYHVGRYPGKPGTVAVALASRNGVQQALGIQHGAIVVGLGRWGELTPTVLTHTVQQGVMEYVLQRVQGAGRPVEHEGDAEWTIHSLLIGSNTAANIAVEDSVNAVVRGVVLANRALRKQAASLPRIAHVQFVELYLDVAADAAKALRRVTGGIEKDLQADVVVSPRLEKGVGGQMRLTPSGARGYWRRWTVTAVPAEIPRPRSPLPPILNERLRAALTPEVASDPAVAAALLDLAFQDDRSLRRRPHKLRFLALSDRARAEVLVQDTQPELITQLIRRSIAGSAFKRDIAKTLFELLIPGDLKDNMRNQDRVVLVLDAVTANYPWELMVDLDQPLCVRMGMIRQLETDDYEARARDTVSTTAYVVGDPLTPPAFPPLPGARQEAAMVASLLRPRFAVTHAEHRPGAEEVLNGLFARPYRIIHIAGHGQYKEEDLATEGAKAGVVLDNGLFLTAVEIARIDPLPELVFLNCCYLGQTGGTTHNKLAASLAQELIRKGVRAVVAAGWPVQDDAALYFAQVFYQQLLAGHPFGRVVQEARRQTWQQYPDSNTWGAYQVYGDPEFCLGPVARGGDGDREDPFVASEELLLALDQLPVQPNREALERALQALQRRSAPEWLAQGTVQERLASVYGRQGEFSDAVAHYEQAARAEDPDHPSTLRALDQWVNLEVRYGKAIKDRARIMKAIDRGQAILGVSPNAERLSVMGSAYKRLAEVEEEMQVVRRHLKEAARCYREASLLQAKTPLPDPYPAINGWVIEALLGEPTERAEARLLEFELWARRRFEIKRSVWDLIAIADLAVAGAYARGRLPDASKELIQTYRQAFVESGATPKERGSALGQLDFMLAMRQKLMPSAPGGDPVAAALAHILKELGEETKTPRPPTPPSPRARRGGGAPNEVVTGLPPKALLPAVSSTSGDSPRKRGQESTKSVGRSARRPPVRKPAQHRRGKRRR